jgi:hypothetical protein
VVVSFYHITHEIMFTVNQGAFQTIYSETPKALLSVRETFQWLFLVMQEFFRIFLGFWEKVFV